MSNSHVKQELSNNGKYRISVFYDECPDSPCTNWDMGACFLFEYGDSATLHEECHWREIYNPSWDNNKHSLCDALIVLINKYVTEKQVIKALKDGITQCKLQYDKTVCKWEILYCKNTGSEWHHDCYLDNTTLDDIMSNVNDYLEFMNEDELITILQTYGKDIVVKEFTLTGYSQGDLIKGVAFCTKEWYEKYDNTDTTDWKNKAIEIIDAETEDVNRWMWGDVYGYVLEERQDFTKTYTDGTVVEDFEWKEIDSCWGFFCEPDEIIKDYLPNDK